MSNPICYGDTVYIDVNDLVLTTNGFYDPTLYLASTENNILKSFRNGLFKLYPNLSYKDTTQVNELRHQLDLLKSLNSEEKFAAEQLEKDMELEQKTLEAREQRLEELNEKMFAESKGHPIRYSQKIQLYHIESQSFLCVTKKLNKEDKTLSNLELTKKGSKELYFMFMPKLAFSQEGEVVEYNTPIKFVSCQHDTCLTKGPELNLASMKTVLNPATNTITNDEDNFPKVAPRRNEPLFDSAKIHYTGVKMIDVPENIYVRKFCSLHEEETAKVKKLLRSGDFLRISNDKLHLTAYRTAAAPAMFFQAFNNQDDYRYSYTATLFQIIEVNDTMFDDASNQKDSKYNASKFPQGHLLEYDETKRYLLKHIVSGLFLNLKDDGTQTLIEYKDLTQEIHKISLAINNKAGSAIIGDYIDRNSIMQLKFFKKSNEEVGTFSSSLPIKIPNVQLEMNTYYYYGFIRPENYLNKFQRTERFSCKVDKLVDDQFSSFRFGAPTTSEISSIFLVESFTNSLQKFIDFLDEFGKKKITSLREFNDEVKKLTDISEHFVSQLFEEEYNEATEDILTPNTTRQTLIREFRAYDLIYRVFFHFIVDELLVKAYKEIQDKAKAPAPKEPEAKVPETVTAQGNEEKKEEQASETQQPQSEEKPTEQEKPAEQEKEKKEEEKQKEEKAKEEKEKETEKPKVEDLKDIDVKAEINFVEMTRLIKALQKVILASFRKNDLNHYYCSQFIRVPINGIVEGKEGLYFPYTSEKEQIEVKELMLTLAQEGLWDKDLDALGQLNFYETPLFEGIEKQTSYHTVFLRLITHIASSKAPNLQNLIRDNFVYNFLNKAVNLRHVVPQLTEEDGRVCIQFKRKGNKDANQLLDLTSLVSRVDDPSYEGRGEEEVLLDYFLESLYLIFAIISVQSQMIELKIMRYLTYDIINKAINILTNAPQYRETRIALKELISKVHQIYFAVPFTKLPKQMQILDKTASLRSAEDDLHKIIKEAATKGFPDEEVKYLKEEELLGEIDNLRVQFTSENQALEVLRTLESLPSIENLELSRTILEDIKKVLESDVELNFDFLKRSREVLNLFLGESIKKNDRAYWDFIKQCLEVYNLMETKTLAYAATDIVRALKEQNLFGARSFLLNSPVKHKRNNSVSSPLSPSDHSDSIESGPLIKPPAKIAPETLEIRELTTRNVVNDTVLATVVDSYMRQWKSGERFLIHNPENSSPILKNRNKVEDTYKESNAEQNMNVLLEVFLLHQDHLLSDVIHRLKRISSFESLLYRELNRLTIIYDDESLEKTTEVIKATFRLHEISRDIFFCKDNLLSVEEDRMKTILNEVLELQWSLFFILYEPSRHFKYLDPNVDAKKAFREAFEKEKKGRWDKLLLLKPEAINKQYQKVFNILKTFSSLIKTQHWVLDKKSGFEESFVIHNYIIRLNVLLLIAFVMNNKENQVLFSTHKGVIRQFYNQHFINQTPDTMLIYSEMMRDNRKLLQLPVKYLYDITMSTFIGTMARSISNNITNAYLHAGLESTHFLSKAKIPVELYSSISDMKNRWDIICKAEDFKGLKIENSEDVFELPFCYYSIRSAIEATIGMAEDFHAEKRFGDIQLYLNFPGWMNMLLHEHYLLQFELKNNLTKCLTKIYYEYESKQKLVQESEECLNLVATLIADIVFFREFRVKKTNSDGTALFNLSQKPNFITNHEKFIGIRKLQEAVKDINLETKRLQIDLEEVPLQNLQCEYIYEGCLDLLFHIILKEVDFCKEIHEANHEVSSIMDYTLALLDEFILGEQNNPDFPHQKIENFLTKASVINSYSRNKEKVLKLTNRVYALTQKYNKTLSINLHKSKQSSPLDYYEKYINNLQASRKLYKEQNIKQVADCIADHPQNKTIITKIIKYLSKDPAKLSSEEIIFILKLLRKYIERENINNPQEDPIFLWKDINLSDLKKIEKIQQTYRHNGLSNLLFTFFGTSDPKIFREATLLSLAYMYGGNTDVQRDFFSSFQNDDDNKVIIQLRDKLKESWEFFRAKETKRMKYLYNSVQKSMFEYFKGKSSEVQIDEEELQIRIFQAKINPEYLAPVENFKENQFFIQTLTFLQALCEGQYTDMQTFLREQKNEDRAHPKSFDFLSFLRHSTNTYYKIMNRYNLLIGNKIIDLVIELIQGDVDENIAVFLYKTFIYDMCRVLTDFNTRYHTLPRGFGMNQFHEGFREFKGKVIFLFKTMLENKNTSNRQILTSHLDVIGLMNVFESLISEFNKKNLSHKPVKDVDQFLFTLTNEDFKATLGDAINIYIIFRYIWEDAEAFNEKMRELIKKVDKKKQDLLDKAIFNIFPRLVSSIEMVDDTQANSLRRVWFPVLAMCHYLNPDTKESFLTHVDRSNSQTKISSLIDASQEFIPQMNAEYNARNWILGFNLSNVYYGLRLMTNMISMVVTFMNIGTFRLEEEEATQEERFETAALGLNITQISLAGILIMLWWLLFRQRHLSLMWERYVDHNVKTIGFLPPTIKNKLDEGDHHELDAKECKLIMKLKGANSDEFKEMRALSGNFKEISFDYNMLKLSFIIKSTSLLWHFVYLGITIGSLFHPLVAVFQIFDIATRSDTILQIYGSISRNARQFVWTLFLLVLVNVVYSSIGFFFLNDAFVTGDSETLCTTSFACFLNVLNLGLRSGGGVADVIQPQPYDPDNVGLFIGRVIFDLSFFILMIILLLNLIFGMIIDAFGELRDEKTKNEEDQKNVCFICGIERSEFERHTNFEEHAFGEHNIWSYIYYLVYIQEKEKNSKNSMTDIERKVLEKYQVKDSSWIPIGKSLTLEKVYEIEKDHQEDDVSKLNDTVSVIQENLAEMNTQMKDVVFGKFGEIIQNLNSKVDKSGDTINELKTKIDQLVTKLAK